MLRGLLIRQGFMAAQALLGVVIIVIAFGALRDLMRSPADVIAANTLTDPDAATVTLNNPIENRPYYNSIVNAGLFGQAGSYQHEKTNAPPKPPPPPVETAERVDTKLPLVLKGTLDAGLTSIFSSASIEIQEKNIGQKAFFIGDEVIDKVFLREISKNEVLLENNRVNPKRMEVLKHVLVFASDKRDVTASPKEVLVASQAPGRASAANPRTRESASARPKSKLVMLNREEIVEKLNRDYEKLASTMDVIEKKDEDGNLIGLSTSNIESIPVAKELGFEDGDILTSINNEKVTSQDQVASLANKYRTASVVHIGFVRDGQAMTTMYRLR
jgi:type II secretory pathway component PulC